jgi:tetratricopeptide (TPR) repeat protein
VLESTKPDQAIAADRQAAVCEPKDPEPHLAAGLLLEKQQKFSDAESEYKEALALDPSSDAVTGLANIYMRGHRLPEAEVELRKLVDARPDQASARIQLGRVLAAEGKNDEAIAELQAGAKLAPTDVSLQRDLADLYSSAKQHDQAEAAYRSLLTASPNDAALHQSLGESLLEQKKFSAAQKEFLEAVKLKPDLGTAYGDLAFAANGNKDYPLTIKALDIRAKLLPEEPTTYFLRASAYDNLKDFKRASANYHLFLNMAHGKYPDQEWQATHRLIAIEPKK